MRSLTIASGRSNNKSGGAHTAIIRLKRVISHAVDDGQNHSRGSNRKGTGALGLHVPLRRAQCLKSPACCADSFWPKCVFEIVPGTTLARRCVELPGGRHVQLGTRMIPPCKRDVSAVVPAIAGIATCPIERGQQQITGLSHLTAG
jgi:hypothetical protein